MSDKKDHRVTMPAPRRGGSRVKRPKQRAAASSPKRKPRKSA